MKNLSMRDFMLLFKTLEFGPMTEPDWDMFSGANPGTIIAFRENYAYLLDPESDVLVIVDADDMTSVEYSLCCLEIN